MIINLNGRFREGREARIAINDTGLLFGDTLFETLKVDRGQVLFRDDHLDRLQLSAGLLDFPMDDAAINDALDRTLERLPWPMARLRLTLSRGPGAGLDVPSPKHGWFAITAAEYQGPTHEERKRGVSCCLAPNRRVNPLSHLPQMKTGNYVDCLYAARHASSRGCREALFVDENQCLLEGATSNLFLVKDEKLHTPPAGRLVLAGVMRRQVMQCAEKMGVPVIESPVAATTLDKCDGAFLTNSLIDILPVKAVEGRPIALSDLSMQLFAALKENKKQKAGSSEGKS